MTSKRPVESDGWPRPHRACFLAAAARGAASTSASRPTMQKVVFFFSFFPRTDDNRAALLSSASYPGPIFTLRVAMAIGFVFNSWPVCSNSCGGTGNCREGFFFFFFLFMAAKSEWLNLRNTPTWRGERQT